MIINSPLNWQVHYEYSRHGLGQDLTDTGSTGPLTNIQTGFSTGVSTMTSGWGIGEYALIGLGAYALLAMFLTTRRGVRGVRKVVSKRRSRRQRQVREYYRL